MLIIEPTKKGVGVSIWGDYGDLRVLYDLFSNYLNMNQSVETSQMGRLLSVMSYEIRHAFQHERLKRILCYDLDNKVTYYGFNTDWITLLFSVRCLRTCVSLMPSTELIQSEMYLFESLVKTAIQKYDTSSYHKLIPYIDYLIPSNEKSVYILHQYCVKSFFESKKKGKVRFRSIPDILERHCLINSYFFKEIQNGIEQMKKEGYNLDDIEIKYDDIEIE